MQDNDSFAGGTYPTPPEPKVIEKSFKVLVEYTFRDIQLYEDETIKDYLECDGFGGNDSYKIIEIEES
ncbi:MAG: hypothetical protein IKU37_01375 [Candidatus Gastranaerophilales bacterium]|nr:hypothetical protein [Candidatus Gastranaerophilales bacterium]